MKQSNSSPRFVRELTLMASLTALNVAARIVLAGGPPNVKPVAFLSLTAGVIGGPLTGLVVGALSIFISDLYFGAGFWTIIDSASLGAVGCLAGFLWSRRAQISRVELVVGGFLLTAIYDVATSVIAAWIFGYSWWLAIVLLYVPFLAGFGVFYPFGFVHEITTAVLMGAIGPTLISRVRPLVSHDNTPQRPDLKEAEPALSPIIPATSRSTRKGSPTAPPLPLRARIRRLKSPQFSILAERCELG